MMYSNKLLKVLLHNWLNISEINVKKIKYLVSCKDRQL